MTDRPLFFLHIPKTAGLSIHWAMVNTFPIDRVARVNSEDEFWRTSITKIHRLAYLSAHAHCGFRATFRNQPFIFTFLRSPVERAVSVYWHLRNEDPSNFNNTVFGDVVMECKRRSLEEILCDSNSLVLNQLSNSQTWHLSGQDVKPRVESTTELTDGSIYDWYNQSKRASPTDLDQSHLERAMRTLDSFPLFGLVEDMSRSLEIFQRRLGLDPKSVPAINRRKTAARDHPLSERAAKRLRELTVQDQRLYDYATRRFNERQEEMAEPDGNNRPFSPLVKDGDVRRELSQEVSQGFIGGGWYPRERRDNAVWCWNGFDFESWIDLYIEVVSDLDVSLEIAYCLDWKLAETLKLYFRGEALPTSFSRGRSGGVLNARLRSRLTGLGPRVVRIQIPSRNSRVPADIQKWNADRRKLSVAVQAWSVRQVTT